MNGEPRNYVSLPKFNGSHVCENIAEARHKHFC